MSNDKNPVVWIISGVLAVCGVAGAWIWDHKTTKERGITEGTKRGYEKAKNEYDRKLLQQADAFLRQKKILFTQIEEYKKLMDELLKKNHQYKGTELGDEFQKRRNALEKLENPNGLHRR